MVKRPIRPELTIPEGRKHNKQNKKQNKTKQNKTKYKTKQNNLKQNKTKQKQKTKQNKKQKNKKKNKQTKKNKQKNKQKKRSNIKRKWIGYRHKKCKYHHISLRFIFDLLGKTGNRGSPRLEVCPRLPVHLQDSCVLICRHLQTLTQHPNTHPTHHYFL